MCNPPFPFNLSLFYKLEKRGLVASVSADFILPQKTEVFIAAILT